LVLLFLNKTMGRMPVKAILMEISGLLVYETGQLPLLPLRVLLIAGTQSFTINFFFPFSIYW